jgi:hypothetical protein
LFDDVIHIKIEQEYSMIGLKMVRVEEVLSLLLMMFLLHRFFGIIPNKIVSCKQHSPKCQPMAAALPRHR